MQRGLAGFSASPSTSCTSSPPTMSAAASAPRISSIASIRWRWRRRVPSAGRCSGRAIAASISSPMPMVATTSRPRASRLDRDNRFVGLHVDLVCNMGAYLSEFGPAVPAFGVPMTPGLYAIPAVHVRYRAVVTNTTPVDAYRGAGRPEAAYLIERLVDKAAREIGVAPDALRAQELRPAAPVSLQQWGRPQLRLRRVRGPYASRHAARRLGWLCDEGGRKRSRAAGCAGTDLPPTWRPVLPATSVGGWS